jgi:hypothetical protein
MEFGRGEGRTYILDGQMADATFWRKEPMIVLFTIGRAKPLYEIVRRQPLSALNAAEALRMPDSIEQIVAILGGQKE